MGLGAKRKVEYEGPADGIQTFKAKWKQTKRGGVKVKLVPAERTPKKKKTNPAGSTSKSNTTCSGSLHEQSEWIDEGVYVEYEIPNGPRTKSSHDYMAEWIPKEHAFLKEIIGREAAAGLLECRSCQASPPAAIWRCRDCLDRPILCGDCCASAHSQNPFHRVELWNGDHFKGSWLWRCGVYIRLCPTNACTGSRLESNDLDEAEEGEQRKEPSSAWYDNDDINFGAKPGSRYIDNRRVVVVVHTNGIHYIPFEFCTCFDCEEEDIQLLRTGFYPSTSTNVRTVFTFALLDDYLLQGLECFTSTHHYYSKLQRLTNKPFPGSVPDRTRELRRVGRQWRRLKELKRHGFGHVDEGPGTGQLALFCPACPQPGINLPGNWEEDPESWKFTQSYVADGNFTCVHRKQKGNVDVWLKKGEGYMVEKDRYAKHISNSQEAREKPTCHEHRAIADKSKTHKGCDVTGIGAIACMRHGCFAPSGVVDFQKGERQMNMDYALSEAIHHTTSEKTRRVILAYDVNCQYSKLLPQRIQQGKWLRISETLTFVFGIGLFHVHGHQESCTARYSLTFIRGAGVSAGEILESLWAVVNEVARSTSTMTLAHRTEVLDAIFGDINWKKMVNMVPTICKNWTNSRLNLARAQEDFDLLNETASLGQQITWRAQLDDAHDKRAMNPAAMDILNVKLDKAPSLARVQNTLMEREQSHNQGVGVTSWIASGIKIQESQDQLRAFIRALPRHPTDLQELEVTKRREALHVEAKDFVENATALFPDVDFDELECSSSPYESIEIEGDDDENSNDNPFNVTQTEAEDIKIPLPSSFDCSAQGITTGDSSKCRLPVVMQEAALKEIDLRVAQANDALEGVRTDIGHKSFLYRSNIRLAEGKKQRTRGYAAVNAVDRSLRLHMKRYSQARWALKSLNAPYDIISRFRPLKKEDTKALTAVYRPNMGGQRNIPVSWIWSMDVSGDSGRSKYLEELYRVNWLRAKSRLERWEEEHTLLTCEMEWVVNYFSFKEKQCLSWISEESTPGEIAYAKKQANMWHLMALRGREAFSKCTALSPEFDLD